MIKFALPALLVAALPAVAQAQDRAVAFERDGIRYVATVRTAGNSQFISGHEVRSGRPFVLRVANGRVSGRYGDSEVRFATPVPVATRIASN